jgi:hypothetical protein
MTYQNETEQKYHALLALVDRKDQASVPDCVRPACQSRLRKDHSTWHKERGMFP